VFLGIAFEADYSYAILLSRVTADGVITCYLSGVAHHIYDVMPVARVCQAAISGTLVCDQEEVLNSLHCPVFVLIGLRV
jgi:hypothetical protein